MRGRASRIAATGAPRLARRVMEHGGVHRSEDWFDAVIADATEMREISLPDPVPLTNVP